jgi:hypothetical protein
LPQILSKNAVLQALSDISGKTREIARMISENPSTIPSG